MSYVIFTTAWKRLYSAYFLGFCFIGTRAQTVDGILLRNINAQYAQIVGTTKYAKETELDEIRIDFNQAPKVSKKKKMEIKDEKGQLLQLTSMIDALNFMTANSYEYVQAYSAINRIMDHLELIALYKQVIRPSTMPSGKSN